MREPTTICETTTMRRIIVVLPTKGGNEENYSYAL